MTLDDKRSEYSEYLMRESTNTRAIARQIKRMSLTLTMLSFTALTAFPQSRTMHCRLLHTDAYAMIKPRDKTKEKGQPRTENERSKSTNPNKEFYHGNDSTIGGAICIYFNQNLHSRFAATSWLLLSTLDDYW